MWSLFFIFLYVFEVPDVSAVKLSDMIKGNLDTLVKNYKGSKKRKPLNKYFVQGGEKHKSKRVKIPLAEYLTSFRLQDFQERLEDYIQRTSTFHNLTNAQATYHFMSGFLSQLEKEFIIESILEEQRADHFLLPRLHSKNDDTVIILQYSGAEDYEPLEKDVDRGLDEMLRQNYKHLIFSHFPGGKKESSRIKKVLLVSLGISPENVILRHQTYKLQSRTDRFAQALHVYMSNHDMKNLQGMLDEYIIASKDHIGTDADLKKLVEGFLDQHDEYYPKKNNPQESIYIPVSRQKHKKNIAYLIRYKVLEEEYLGVNRSEDLEDELDDCFQKNNAYFEQFPTVDTVRTVLLTHKKV